jgi:hypothetical protein
VTTNPIHVINYKKVLKTSRRDVEDGYMISLPLLQHYCPLLYTHIGRNSLEVKVYMTINMNEQIIGISNMNITLHIGNLFWIIQSDIRLVELVRNKLVVLLLLFLFPRIYVQIETE